jgi:hypothetical protein
MNPFGTRKTRGDTARLTAMLMLAGGLILLVLAIVFASSTTALVGLGLTFWGAILNCIQGDEYVRRPLLDRISAQSLTTMDRLLHELGFQGTAVYLPPNYFTDPDTTKAYIPRRDGELPTPEHIEGQEDLIFTKNPDGVLFIPPGAEITRLFEESMGTSLTAIDLPTLAEQLPKLMEETLELAQNVRIRTHDSSIHVRMENTAFPMLNEETSRLATPAHLGSHLLGAVACALAKTTGRPIVIHRHRAAKAGRTIEVEYRTIDEGAA